MLLRVQKIFLPVLVVLLLSAVPHHGAFAQHPIDIQRKTAQGDYMAALRLFDKMPKRVSTAQSRIAAARSAWALSLPERALAEFDRAVTSDQLTDLEKAQIHLAKGIIEFQENRFQMTILQAEKGLSFLKEPSPLRAQLYSLEAEASAEQKAFAKAEDFYIKALAEIPPESKTEIFYQLGRVQFLLGRYQEAQKNLEVVPVRHERAPEAIRLLAKVAIEKDNLTEAAFWLTQGRREYSDQFLDSWVDYVMLKSAANNKDFETVTRIASEAEKKLPPSDSWLIMLKALSEESFWREQHGGPQ